MAGHEKLEGEGASVGSMVDALAQGGRNEAVPPRHDRKEPDQ